MKRNHPVLVVVSLLAIGYAVVLFLLALDALGQETITVADMLGWSIHSIPSLIILVIVVVGWKRPKVGSLGFAALTVGFAWFFRGGGDWISYVIILGVPVLLAILYAIVWMTSTQTGDKES